jgi:hypothetical protein
MKFFCEVAKYQNHSYTRSDSAFCIEKCMNLYGYPNAYESRAVKGTPPTYSAVSGVYSTSLHWFELGMPKKNESFALLQNANYLPSATSFSLCIKNGCDL